MIRHPVQFDLPEIGGEGILVLYLEIAQAWIWLLPSCRVPLDKGPYSAHTLFALGGPGAAHNTSPSVALG